MRRLKYQNTATDIIDNAASGTATVLPIFTLRLCSVFVGEGVGTAVLELWFVTVVDVGVEARSEPTAAVHPWNPKLAAKGRSAVFDRSGLLSEYDLVTVKGGIIGVASP